LEAQLQEAKILESRRDTVQRLSKDKAKLGHNMYHKAVKTNMAFREFPIQVKYPAKAKVALAHGQM
jgi:hypothetical protein